MLTFKWPLFGFIMFYLVLFGTSADPWFSHNLAWALASLISQLVCHYHFLMLLIKHFIAAFLLFMTAFCFIAKQWPQAHADSFALTNALHFGHTFICLGGILKEFCHPQRGSIIVWSQFSKFQLGNTSKAKKHSCLVPRTAVWYQAHPPTCLLDYTLVYYTSTTWSSHEPDKWESANEWKTKIACRLD